MSEKFKEQYLKVQKKYALPSFEQLDQEFDLGSLEENSLPLRQVRKRISEVLESFVNILENIMHPESSISGLYECKILDDQQKELLFSSYRQIMRMLRYSLEIELKSSEEQDAVFIRDTFKLWPQIKKSLLPFIIKLKESWEKESVSQEDLGYLG